MPTKAQEKILVENFELFREQAKKAGSAGIDSLLEERSEDIILAPASTRLEYVCCYPGGLVEHSLRVLNFMAKLRVLYEKSLEVPVTSVVLVGLFHDIGKIGSKTKNYYVEKDSKWHQEKLGQFYDIHDKFKGISVNQLSLFTLTENEVKLNLDEWYAISSLKTGQLREDSFSERSNTDTTPEPWLSVLLQQGVKAAIMEGRNKTEASKIG